MLVSLVWLNLARRFVFKLRGSAWEIYGVLGFAYSGSLPPSVPECSVLFFVVLFSLAEACSWSWTSRDPDHLFIIHGGQAIPCLDQNC
jgi:hypothetical protein